MTSLQLLRDAHGDPFVVNCCFTSHVNTTVSLIAAFPIYILVPERFAWSQDLSLLERGSTAPDGHSLHNALGQRPKRPCCDIICRMTCSVTSWGGQTAPWHCDNKMCCAQMECGAWHSGAQDCASIPGNAGRKRKDRNTAYTAQSSSKQTVCRIVSRASCSSTSPSFVWA